MSNTNNLILNRLFSKNTFSKIISNDDNKIFYSVIKRFVPDYEHKTRGECISTIYQTISKEYRNEYLYKNTLLNKLLIGIHKVSKTVAFTEIPINKSKADFIMINGKAIFYEIKTDLDNLDRLDSQIKDYYKAFDHVCVVTNENDLEKVISKLSSADIGVYALRKNDSFQHYREPRKNRENLDYLTMFKILRKNEFEIIVKNFYNYLPKVTPVEYYDACFNLFKKIEINELYDFYISILKKRNVILKEEYLVKVPPELKFVIYFLEYKAKDYDKLQEFLNEKAGG